VHKLTDDHFTDEKLKECNHPYDSQTNEAFNTSVAQVAPKNYVFARTISLKARISVAVIRHSVGMDELVVKVMLALGASDRSSTTAMRKWAVSRDRRRKYKSEYEKRISVKRKRSIAVKRKQAATMTQDAKAKKEACTTHLEWKWPHQQLWIIMIQVKDVPRAGGGLDHKRRTSKKCSF
jgi:hypothetical protein